jgi:hypothetical protein
LARGASQSRCSPSSEDAAWITDHQAIIRHRTSYAGERGERHAVAQSGSVEANALQSKDAVLAHDSANSGAAHNRGEGADLAFRACLAMAVSSIAHSLGKTRHESERRNGMNPAVGAIKLWSTPRLAPERLEIESEAAMVGSVEIRAIRRKLRHQADFMNRGTAADEIVQELGIED